MKEAYQKPALEEMDSTLFSQIVLGDDTGSSGLDQGNLDDTDSKM